MVRLASIRRSARKQALMSPELLAWADRIRSAWDRNSQTGAPVLTHRKIWEWVYIIQALHERDLLREGRAGLGFGVGTDPLTALPLPVRAARSWPPIFRHRRSPMPVAGRPVANTPLASRTASTPTASVNRHSFDQLVQFRPVDMRSSSRPDLRKALTSRGRPSALEHLEGRWRKEKFLLRQMDCLKPGGYAVHTTEYNVESNAATVGLGHTVLYRKRDIEALAGQLRRLGHRIEIDYSTGTSPADRHVDQHPWGGPHLKIQLERFVTTSLALVIQKNPAGSQAWTPDPSCRLRALASGRQIPTRKKTWHPWRNLETRQRHPRPQIA